MQILTQGYILTFIEIILDHPSPESISPLPIGLEADDPVFYHDSTRDPSPRQELWIGANGERDPKGESIFTLAKPLYIKQFNPGRFREHGQQSLLCAYCTRSHRVGSTL